MDLSRIHALTTGRLPLIAASMALAVSAFASAPAGAGTMQSAESKLLPQKRPAKTIGVGTIQYKLVVSDLDKSGAFYGKVLQLRQAMRFTSSMNRRPMEEILLDQPNGELVPLVLIKFLDGVASTHDQAVLVFFTDDIDAFMARVEQNGGKITERRDDPEHKARIAFWYDPEGNLAETVQMQ